ncbi:MAG: Fe-S cluster assembly protein SufD [Bdellovibrionales bacterium]|nr:Fe-S cluster assembly protein SufD [Bdellovibrionales bacterium]
MLLFNPPQWLKAKQTEALKAAQELGWPQKRDEGWKYTSVRELQALSFANVAPGQNQFQLPTEVKNLVASADSTLFFYNGEYLKDVSSAVTQEDIVVSSLTRVLMSAGRLQERAKSFIERKPNKNLKNIGLNILANFNQGAYIQIDGGDDSVKKIAAIHLYGNLINTSEQKPFAVYSRNIYSFAENIEAEFIEIHLSVNQIQFQASCASDIHLSAGAKVRMAKVVWLGEEAFGFHDVQASLERDSALEMFDLNIGGKLIRNEVAVNLSDSGAELNLYNLNIAKPDSHIDNSTSVIHLKGNTSSEQIVRSVLSDHSKSIFSGKLRIEQDAQKSDASQYCHNLLLSDSAEADARPQLEVFADDVKAAHGTTIGQLSAEQLFYLQSRAISKADAEKMLADGFQEALIGKIKSSFLKHIVESCVRGLS